MDIRTQLLELLTEVCPGVDFENETALIDDEILESLDIVTIVSEMVDTFCIELNVNDLLPENFNTLDAMVEMVIRRKSAQ